MYLGCLLAVVIMVADGGRAMDVPVCMIDTLLAPIT